MNLDKTIQTAWQKAWSVLASRTAMALLSGAIATAALGALRPQYQTGVYPDRFWQIKMHWPHCADVVAGGDSRVYLGVSPQVLRQALGDRRILNFGFSGCGFSSDYLAALKNVLDPNSPTRIIILGISPASVGIDSTRNNEFHSQLRVLPGQSFLIRCFGEVMAWFEPTTPKEFKEALWPPKRPDHYYRHYYADGWVAARRTPENPRFALHTHFDADHKVCPDLLAGLEDFIRQCRREGIRIYLYRPPTTAEVARHETEGAEFDEQAIAARMEAAGGTWLQFPPDAYPSFDGSHLREDGARQFSLDLANKILQQENAR